MILSIENTQNIPSLSKMVKDIDTTSLNFVFFESKAYHEKNYSSYLMIDYLIKVTILNNSFNIHCSTLRVLSEMIEFIESEGIDFIANDLTITIRFKAKHAFKSQDEMIRNHPYFDVIRAMIAYFAKKYALPDKYIFPMVFSYDLIDQFYDVHAFDEKQNPDFQMYMPRTLIYEDVLHQHSILMTFDEHFEIPNVTHKKFTLPFDETVSVSVSDDEFAKQIETAKKHINNGEVYQLVISRTFQLDCPNPLKSYETLREKNPSPYMFIVKDNFNYLFGASPERAVQLQEKDNTILTSPIAGTKPREFDEFGNIDVDTDNKLALELKLDKKEIAEHIMLVDLARNDIASISEVGTRTVSRLMEIETYSHVIHLVSEVKGKLKPEFDGFHAYQALMNMGTLTGSPKFRAYQLLREIEKRPRGYYGGSIGFVDVSGNMNTAIIIRSAHVINDKASITAGAGIVYDSMIESEVRESENKAKAVIDAIIIAHKEIENENITV